MSRRTLILATTLLGGFAVARVASAQTTPQERFHVLEPAARCFRVDPDVPLLSVPDPYELRAVTYQALGNRHKLAGLASYYSTSLDGTLTATGEIFRNRHLTAAHLTLPLGTWIEVESRATGKKIRCRVNDRGPYAKKFILDLSQAAARALGVDVAEDRYVAIHVIALPGETPLPDDWQAQVATASSTMASAAVATPER